MKETLTNVIELIAQFISLSELVAQLVRASASGVCRANRHRFEPQATRDFLSVTLYHIVLLFYCIC